jgi:alpha-maltose-1-phosphate synthase
MPPRVLFVNGGILGLRSFHRFIEAMLPAQSRIVGEQILLTEGLSVGDRVRRRFWCQRVWHDGWLGVRNADLARWRHELHAGRLARRRIDRAWHEGVDVIHFHRQATAYGSLDLMRRVPSIVSIDCTQACVLQQARSRVERASYVPNVRRDGAVFEAASRIVAASQWAADSVREMYPACRTPLDVMPTPVLLEWFDLRWIEDRRARAAGGGRPRFLFMGGDFPRKGGPLLLDAWVHGRFADRAELVLVTDWPLPILPAGVRRVSGVKAHSAEWAACWAGADAFVMPTHDEAFGLVYEEAAAAGLPAIGTLLNAIPEIVLDGRTGVLVPPADRDALIAAMDRLVGSAELREQLGAAARRHIGATAEPRAYFDRLTDIVLEIAAGRAEPARADTAATACGSINSHG